MKVVGALVALLAMGCGGRSVAEVDGEADAPVPEPFITCEAGAIVATGIASPADSLVIVAWPELGGVPLGLLGPAEVDGDAVETSVGNTEPAGGVVASVGPAVEPGQLVTLALTGPVRDCWASVGGGVVARWTER